MKLEANRGPSGAPHDATAEKESVLRFGSFELNLHSGELRKKGVRIKLQDQPLRVLVALLERPGKLVTREELRDRIWPGNGFGDFDHAINLAVGKLRSALDDSADAPRLIETLPRRGYRFIAAVDPISPPRIAASKPSAGYRFFPFLKSLPIYVLVAIVALIGAAIFYPRHKYTLGEKDSIVLADFTNGTGDPVFDLTLREGLAVELEQSPFLNIVSDERIQHTLRLMERPANAPLTHELARQVCERAGAAAFIEGSIAKFGSHYVLTLNATRCRDGSVLARQQVQANDKEQVLSVLGDATRDLRRRVGELRLSIQYDKPLREVTTSSLDALRAYSIGTDRQNQGDSAGAIPFLQHAIELDPQFGSAFLQLGLLYDNLGLTEEGTRMVARGYAFRDHATEFEKLRMELIYFSLVTGDLQQAHQTAAVFMSTYPRSSVGPNADGINAWPQGDFERALVEHQESARLNPENPLYHGNIAQTFLFLNRPEEAEKAIHRASEFGLDPAMGNILTYLVLFSRNDNMGIESIMKWAKGKRGIEEIFDGLAALTEAYHGRANRAEQLNWLAADLASQARNNEDAGAHLARSAWAQALLGNNAIARKDALAAFAKSPNRYSRATAALALAYAGELGMAQSRSEELNRVYPVDTFLQFNLLPSVRAAVALRKGSPAQALSFLQPTATYELGNLGSLTNPPSLSPVYLRGEAYLAIGNGPAAAAEFQAIIDHPGAGLNHTVGALAHLGLGRALVLAGDTKGARKAYEDFFSLWKGADADVPILRHAKVEYEKLQCR